MNRTTAVALALGMLLLSGPRAEASGAPKVPVSLTWGPGGRLYVALRDGKGVAVVDPGSWTVAEEWALEDRLASIAAADDGSSLLAGTMDGELLVLGPGGRVVRRVGVGRGPERVLPLPDGLALAGSPWDGAVRVIDWTSGRVRAVHPLPFPPGASVRRPDGRVVVADAFGRRLAVIEPGAPGGARVRTLDGANLHAMAVSGDGRELLVAHLAQYDAVPITRSNIDWGLVLSARLSAVRLSDLDRDEPTAAPLPRRRLTLDGSSHGAADPAAMAVSADGTRVVIALSGSHQLMLDDRTAGGGRAGASGLLPLGHNQRLEVVEVGRNPCAVVLDPSGTRAVTADAMSDTLSVVRLDGMDLERTVRLSRGPSAPTPELRGEALFRDGRLALDRWMSCASCHAGGHTNGLNFDTLGDGDYGAPKNTPTLLGVGGTAPYAWTGRSPDLPDQVRQSIATSLHGAAVDPQALADLTAYLRALPTAPPPRAASDPAARRGAEVFRARRCDVCHRPPLYTTAAARDVGLDDASGHRRFNPPSLRGVAWSAPYFHDGRAASLREVLEVHAPGSPKPLEPGDRDDLVAFLESL